MMRAPVSIIVMIGLTLSGCFRLRVSEEAQMVMVQAQELENQRNHQAQCALLQGSLKPGPDGLFLLAQCVEQGGIMPELKNRKATAIELYSKAARCGSDQALSRLRELDALDPELSPVKPGEETILPNNPVKECGLETEITATGWAVSPIAVPAAAAVGAAAVAIGAAFLTAFLAVGILVSGGG
ncbi:MAG: hypothetical protein KDD42_01675 [Bdellovibrionales bacterium]|nr:hypothetical protein [Bdellovibrionales bacterium]